MVSRRWGRRGVCSKISLLLLGCKKENVTTVFLLAAPGCGVGEGRQTATQRGAGKVGSKTGFGNMMESSS